MLKDERLHELITRGINVAQFVSFGPPDKIRFHGICGLGQSQAPATVESAVETIFQSSFLGSIDIRTFLAHKPDGNPFEKDIKTTGAALQLVRKFLGEGYFVIVSERIPIEGSGRFGGVLLGDIIQGAANETPRCVDNFELPLPVLSLSRRMGLELLQLIYGCVLQFPFAKEDRIEFSVHTGPVGYYRKPQLIWQVDQYPGEQVPGAPAPFWPNRISEDMGDKPYGLVMAHLHGLLVPKTSVIGRVFPQFTFGRHTHSGESLWIRTCPKVQTPGKYATRRVWEDPFLLMQREDPDGTKISSLIIQEGVRSEYAGALLTDADGKLIIEGKSGEGVLLMIGERGPEELPPRVIRAVERLYLGAREIFGDIRMEWVFDGDEAWCVQIHLGRAATKDRVIYPGKPQAWQEFSVLRGLEALRLLVQNAQEGEFGIVLRGNVGVTGHFAEILCGAKIPSRIEP